MWQHLQELNTWKKAEFKFHPARRWRFDFAIANAKHMLAIEIDGGMWIQGRHTRGSGQMKDNEKFNHAALLGWRVLRFAPSQVLDGTAIYFIKKVLES